MTAGGVLLLVVLLLIVRGCAGKTKSVNSSNINNATDENTTAGNAVFFMDGFDSRKAMKQ